MTKTPCLLFFLLFSILFFYCFDANSQSAQNFLSNGKKNYQLGYYQDAIDDFTNALSVNNQLEEAYYFRGKSYAHLNNYDKAIDDFSEAVKLEPTHYINYDALAQACFSNFEYEKAVEYFSKAIDLIPSQAHMYLHRAEAYLYLNRFPRALSDCESAINYQPDFALAYSTRGIVNIQQGNIVKGIEDIQKAIDLDARDPLHQVRLGDAYFQIKEYDQALVKYDNALNIKSNDANALYGKANVYLIKKKFDDAQENANQAILNDKNLKAAYLVRAISYFKTGQISRAETDIDSYLDYAKRNEDYYTLAWFISTYLQDEEMLERAEEWTLTAISLKDTYPANLLYANILFQLNQPDDARVATERAIAIADKNGESAYLAKNLLKLIDEPTTVDNIPPVLEILEPSASNRGFAVVDESETLTIKGKVSDDSGIDNVLINGNPATLQLDGRFEGVVALDANETVVTLSATDLRGNTTEQKFVVQKQNSEPKTVVNNTSDSPRNLLGKQQALLIATNDYDEWTDLVNPVFDAETIAEDLEDIYDFDVDLLKNPTQEDIILKIREYTSKSYQQNDELLIFIAGHGQFDEVLKEGYLVAKDSKLMDATKSSYIAHSLLRNYIDNIPCEHILLVMDVCFGGTFDPVVARRGGEDLDDDMMEYVNRKLKYKTRRYITSGGKEYVPDGRPGEHSPFARALLEGLRSEGGSDGIFTLDDILYYTQSVSPQPQSGEFGDNEPGSDFLFIAD